MVEFKIPATVPLFVGGRAVKSSATRHGPVFNPSTGETISQCPMCGTEEIDAAVRTAHEAFTLWAETPVVERARIMFRLVHLLERDAASLARTISLEHGKTRAESLASVRRGIEMVEYACSIPALTMGDTVHNLAQDVDCETFHYPLGVCVGITPFNFPFMVPLWMAPIAITCGNTFILKPSEKVPLSAIRLAELFAEAGLPPGVFNVVHGDKTAVDALLTHPLVQAVSFVGSTPIAKYIYDTAVTHGKRCQANGGAKNHIIVMPDADLDRTVAALQSSAFGCSGQRCMAGSLAVAVGNAGDPLLEAMRSSAQCLRVGRTDIDAASSGETGHSRGIAASAAGAADMGPVITRQHLDSILANIDRSVADGATLARDGRGIRVEGAPNGFYLGPTILDRVEPGSHAARTELFGPVLAVARAATLDDAISMTQSSEYGNGAVIYTRSGRAAREFKHRASAGMIGINVGVPAPMAMFPFTGHKASFFGDLHIQGREGIAFYTQQKVVMSRWPGDGNKDAPGEFVTTRG